MCTPGTFILVHFARSYKDFICVSNSVTVIAKLKTLLQKLCVGGPLSFNVVHKHLQIMFQNLQKHIVHNVYGCLHKYPKLKFLNLLLNWIKLGEFLLIFKNNFLVFFFDFRLQHKSLLVAKTKILKWNIIIICT